MYFIDYYRSAFVVLLFADKSSNYMCKSCTNAVIVIFGNMYSWRIYAVLVCSIVNINARGPCKPLIQRVFFTVLYYLFILLMTGTLTVYR